MKGFMYMKVNALVKEALGIKFCPRTADGNHLVFIPDIKRFDRNFLAHPAETASMLGGVLLTDPEAKEEQTGKVIRPMPVATDPRFVTAGTGNPEGSGNPEDAEADENPDRPDDSQSEEGGES